MATAALLVSILSVLVAAASSLYARQAAVANRRIAAIEAERREDERAEAARLLSASMVADLRVSTERDSPWGSPVDVLVLRNLGPAVADGVSFEIVATVGEGSVPELVPGDVPTGLETIRPGDSIRRLMALDFESASRFLCRISWTDGHGSHTRREEVALPGLY
jgi:hypothetical protein